MFLIAGPIVVRRTLQDVQANALRPWQNLPVAQASSRCYDWSVATDVETAAATDARFDGIDARHAGIDARFLEERAHTESIFQDAKRHNRIVAEGVATIATRLDRRSWFPATLSG